MKAQYMPRRRSEETLLNELVGTYYKTSIENARIGAKAQAANGRSTRAARRSSSWTASNSIMEMGYIKKKPGRDAIDWTLARSRSIAENPDLYGKLKYKSA